MAIPIKVNFATKTDYAVRPSVPAGQKESAAEFNQVTAALRANYDRLVLRWDTDIAVNFDLAVGMYVHFTDNEIYRITTAYNVGSPITWVGGNATLVGNPGGGASDWGDLGGTVTDQTDLVAYIAAGLADTLSDAEDYTDAAISQEVIDRDAAIAAALSGLNWKNAVLATTADITLSGEQTIDGTLTSATRVLVKSQSTPSQNGIYVSAAGAWARSTDADTNAEVQSAAVIIASGTANAGTTWVQTQSAVNIGSTSITFQQLGSSVPAASPSTAGIAKLYVTPDGTNTDGAVSQAGVNSKFRNGRTVTGADSVVQTDDNGLIKCNSATPFSYTIDQLTAGSKVSFVNYGAGVVTFVNGTGVTLVGDVALDGADGDSYPSALILWDSATSPRVVKGGALTSADRIDVVLSGSDYTFDCLNKKIINFDIGVTLAAGAKVFLFDNDSNLVESTITMRITGVATITMPASVVMDNIEVVNGRWNNTTKVLTLTSITTNLFSMMLQPDSAGNILVGVIGPAR